MDWVFQSLSNIYGSNSGNRGDNNVIGNNNTINHNTYLQPVGTVGNRSGEFGRGDAAARPYRLIPYGRNNGFTGRKNLLEAVGGFSEHEGHNRIALYGLGGSGKTQVALEYVYQRTSESDCNIFWVQGSGVLKFSEGFRAIAQHVGIHLANAGIDDQDFLLVVRRWFEGPKSGDWILVIDNADNEADFVAGNSPIAKFVPHSTKGTLIFTTRSRQVASRQGCEMIKVVKMAEEEAEELFSKRFGSWDTLGNEEKEVVAMILNSVDHLPLAVVGLAAFMIETETPPSVYWAIFQEKEERMKELLSQDFSDIQREADVTESILGTYFVTFDRINRRMPRAAHLLWLMAFFDRQNIPEELLNRSGLGEMDNPVEFRRAIGKLLGFSLVTIVKRESKTFYELHRLVQLSLQVYLPTQDLNEWRTTALEVVSRCFPQDENERRRIGPTYILYALAVTKDSADPIAEELCFRIGEYFLDMGSYNNAETQFRRCLRPGHPHGLSGIENLATVLYKQGRYNESEAMSRGVLEECEKVLGPDHPHTLSSVGNLAIVLEEQGRYHEAGALKWRALEVWEKVLGPDHPNTLSSLSNLAVVLHKQGRYKGLP